MEPSPGVAPGLPFNPMADGIKKSRSFPAVSDRVKEKGSMQKKDSTGLQRSAVEKEEETTEPVCAAGGRYACPCNRDSIIIAHYFITF